MYELNLGIITKYISLKPADVTMLLHIVVSKVILDILVWWVTWSAGRIYFNLIV